MALITFNTLVDRQSGNPDTPISRSQYDALTKRGVGHDKDFYALYDSNADGTWDTAFELSDTNGSSGRLGTLSHDDTVADPVTITATGRVGATTVGNLTNDITFDNARGFGVSSPGGDDDGAHVLNSGEALDFALNPVGGKTQVLEKVSFVVQTGEGEGRDEGHRNASPVAVYLDFDGSTLARVNGHWQTSAAYALTGIHDGDAIVVDFVNHTITENGHFVPNVPAAFWAAYQAAGADNLTIGSGADDSRGFAVDHLSLATAPATVANHPAVIGDPTVHDVTEDVNPIGGALIATGTIPISDPDAGQNVFQTTVHSATGNLGSLTLQASGAYTYSVADSAVQYLGASDSKVDTFTVSSLDGTQKQIAFTIHGANDVAVIGGVATGDVTEDTNPTTLTATGALTVSDADQGQSSFAAQAGITGSNGYGAFSLDATGHWTYSADNTQPAIQGLAVDQQLTDSFTAVSSDGSASQVVTVTMHGANDVISIADGTVDASATKAASGHPNELIVGSGIQTNHFGLVEQTDVGVELGLQVLYRQGPVVTTTDTYSDGVLHFLVNDGAQSTANGSQVDNANRADWSFDYSIATGLSGHAGNLDGYTFNLLYDVDPGAGTSYRTLTLEVGGSGSSGHEWRDQGTGLVFIADDSGNADVTQNSENYAFPMFQNFLTAAYGPGGGFAGPGHFDIELEASRSNQLLASNHIVVDVNAAPKAVAITGNANEDTGNPVTLAASYTDADPTDTHTFAVNTAGTHGAVVNNGDGTFAYNPNGQFESLAAGATATDTFTYTVTDNHGARSTATATVTIHGENDPATIGGVSTGDVTEDSNPATLTVTGALTVSDPDQGQSSFITQAGTAGSNGYGTFSLDAAGHWTYSANDTQAAIQQLNVGQTLTDSFTAVSSDGSASQVVTVTIHGVDDAPVTAPVTLAPIAEDSGARLITQAELLANATDVDGPTLSAVNLQIASGNGAITDNGNGTWSYTPAANDDTSVSFSYQVSDGTLSAPGSATLDITPVNDAPTIDVSHIGVPNVTTINFDSLNTSGGDVVGAPVTAYFAAYGITIQTGTEAGTAANSGPLVVTTASPNMSTDTAPNVIAEGALQGATEVSYSMFFASPLTQFSFERAGFTHGGIFPAWSVTAFDGQGHQIGSSVGSSSISSGPFPAQTYTFNGPDIAQIQVTGNAQNVAGFVGAFLDDFTLTRASDVATTAEDTPLTLTTISVADIDAGTSPIQVTLGVGSGTLSLGATAGLTVSGLGSGAVVLTGSQADIDTALAGGLTYTPSHNYNGGDTLTITANDLGNTGTGGPLSATQSVNLIVTPVNDAAVISGTTTGTVVESGTSFGDEFNISAPTPTHWDMTGGPQWANAGRLIDPSGTEPFNNELQWYVNPAAAAGAALPDPFNVGGGNLTISAAPASINNYYDHYNYSSGLITSYDSYKALYGYFEMRAELPAGKGLLPAFWLLPADGSHAELDAMEVLGSDPTTLYTTVHSHSTGNLVSTGAATTVADMSAGYHTYGVDWEPTTITWYFDGQQVFQTATPSDLNTPMYLIANLAVGGSWPGSPDGTTPFPANYSIDYIRAYDAPPPPATVTGTLTDTDVDNPANTFQAVSAATASDHGYGTFTMTAGGTWAYTLDNANTAVQALNVGDTLTDTFTVHTIDGTAQQVTVTIDGANDSPTITSGQQAAAGSVAEDQNPLASGQITSSDVDHNDTATWSVDGGHAVQGDFVALLDDFKVTSASGVSLDDTFDGTVPLSGVGSPYGASITTTIPEVDGHALLEGTLAAANGGFEIQSATFTTPTTANGNPRLSQDTTFDATARYDFVNPEDINELYGVRLTDRVNTSTGVDTLELSVRRDFDGHLAVQFRHIDLTTNQASVLGEVGVDPAQLAGSQIELHLVHGTAGSNDISAFFDVIDSNGNTTSVNVPGTGQIFTVPGEDWTRAQFIAREPTETDSTKQGVYGNLTVDQQGHWQYLLNDSAPNVQALAAGQHVTDAFDVLVTDSHGGVGTQHVTIDVVGKNDAPVLQALGGNGTQTFDQTTGLTLSGTMGFSDVDLADIHSVTLQPQANNYLGSINAVVSTDSTGTGHGVVTVNYALTAAQIQAASGNFPAMQDYVATLTDNNGLSSTQIVSIPLAQIVTPYITPPDNPPVIAGVQTTAFVLDSNSHNSVTLTGSFDFTDLDQLDHHTLSMDVQPVGFAPSALGTLTYSFAGGNDGSGAGAGTVNWSYTVDPSTWPGGVIHHEYLDIVVTDSAGAHASHTLDIDYEPGATTTSSSLSVSIAGTAQEGQTLSAQASGYHANAALTYQWQGSPDNGATWSAIAGATASTYAVQESDENSVIRVMATDAVDSVNTFSAATASIVDAYPTNASVTISGLAKQGQTLDANLSVGTDSDLGTATFQWQISTDNGASWTNIAGANGVHYTATESDEDNLLRVSVIATDDTNQSISLVSAATAPVADNVSTTIQGNTAAPVEGQILIANFIGDNDGVNAQPPFQWQSSSDNGANWTNIAGATAQTYQVQEADEGHLLRAIGMGVEVGGEPVSAASAATGAVVDAALTLTVTVTGAAQEGQTLTAHATANDADAVISGYQWQSSADNGVSWSNIIGATAVTYTAGEADENHLIRVAATAQDADGGGSATANSAATSPVIDVTSVAAVTIAVGAGLAVQGSQTFSKFLGFGDSNIDSGYFFTHAISNNATLQNQYNAAVAAGGGLPTSIGGAMNSQLLAADYGLTAIPVGEPGGTNYAASGATVTGNLANSLAPSVTSQIQTYLASTGGVADPNALYLISGGGNDFKIAQTLSGQAAQFGYMDNAANALVSDLSQLQAAGAKYIVIDDGAGRNALIAEFNTALWAGLDAAGVHYLAADDATLVRQITSNPAPYGITNTVQPPAGPFTPANPYSPANGGADIDPLPNLASKGWSLYSTAMQSANAGQTYLWSDNEHLTAAGKLAEANYTHNLIQNGVPTPGEVLTANSALIGEADNTASTFAYQWQHSFDDGHTWSNILNATAKNYTVAAADDGARLRVVATTTDDAGDAYTAVSPETYVVSDGAEAPSVAVPASLSATAGGSVALPITVTAADADDTLGNVTISGLPGDVTLTDSNNDALVVNNGSITLTQAELVGLTLHAGSTAATLSITADASEGGTTATSAVQHVALDVSTPLAVSNFVNLTAPGSLNGIGSASDINNAGIVVGNDETYDNITIQGGDGWLYQNGVYTFVHIGNQNNVSDINDYGVLAGFYSPNNSTPRYGFIENGVGQPVTTIDLSPNVSTDVEGINDSGDYVGSSYLHGGNTYSAFSVIGGNLTYFNPFGSTDAHANGINNAGDIVGTYGNDSFLEHNGVFTTIDVPGATRTGATDINNAGQVVGLYWDSAGHTHGYIETNGVFVTVDHPLGTNGTGVYGLNDAGQIAGNYYDASNSPKAYIATINNPVGAATDDVLVANPQGATLVGGAGNDTFVFTAAPQTANTIADFTPGSDVIQVSAFGFGGGLTHGVSPTVLTGAPASVTNAAPGGDFIFDNSDPNGGTLYWDANGGSGADATPVAVLHGVSSVHPTDFHVV